MSAVAPFPNLLITGLEPNATRWLRFNLDRHPDIVAPPLDIHFFADADRMAERGLRWYCEQFRDWDGEPYRVEMSTTYIDHRYSPIGVADRINRTIPDVSMTIVVGNPVDLFEAGWRRRVQWGLLDPTLDPTRFTEMRTTHPEFFQVVCFQLYFGNLLSTLIPVYQERFGDRLQLLFLDDIRADPAEAYRSVLRHIGARDDIVPDGIELPRYGDPDRLPEITLDEAHRQYLFAFFRRDVEHFAALAGRSLEAWDPGIGPDTPSPQEVARAMQGDG